MSNVKRMCAPLDFVVVVWPQNTRFRHTHLQHGTSIIIYTLYCSYILKWVGGWIVSRVLVVLVFLLPGAATDFLLHVVTTGHLASVQSLTDRGELPPEMSQYYETPAGQAILQHQAQSNIVLSQEVH